MINVLRQFYKWIGLKSSSEKKHGEPFFMYLSVVIAFLTAFTSGLSISWTSPVIPKFKTIENPFNHNVTTTQVATLTSFLPLGAVTGPILAGRLSEQSYLYFLQEELPVLLEDVLITLRFQMWHMLYRAPAQFSVIVRDHLHAIYPNRIIRFQAKMFDNITPFFYKQNIFGEPVCAMKGYVADRYGRKFTMMLLGFPSMIGFCLLAFSKMIEIWYLARFLLGIGVGCYFAICPMYVAEISQNHNRAKFGCLFGVFITLGLFYPFSVGAHIIIPLYAMTCNIPLVVFLIVFGIFMPETPIFLLSKGKIKEAENALVKLRKKKPVEVQDEINELMVAVELEKQGKGGFKELITSQPAKRAVVICVGLVFIQELSGIHPMMAYLKPIFQASGTKISPDISTVIFGLSQISSNFITALIVEKIGRRILYMISAVGCCIACAVLAVYFFLQAQETDLESVFWIPLTCMVGYMIFFSCGLGPLAWSIVGEIFPSSIKGIGSGLTVCASFSASFLVLMTFPIMSEEVGMFAPFFQYTVIIFVGMFFIYYMVPETRGMTLAEIQETLKKTDRKSKKAADKPATIDNVTSYF